MLFIVLEFIFTVLLMEKIHDFINAVELILQHTPK